MSFQCEKFVKSTLPNLRAEVVRILVKKEMKKSEIAKRLNITKSAVTQYEKKIRGKNTNKKIELFAKRIAEKVRKSEDFSELLCDACMEIWGKNHGCKKNKK